MNDMNDLYELMEVFNISIKCVLKRIDEDFDMRYIWRAEFFGNSDDWYECKWEGFKTSKGCISNMIKTLKKVKNKKYDNVR
jgi:hypothetical protein